MQPRKTAKPRPTGSSAPEIVTRVDPKLAEVEAKDTESCPVCSKSRYLNKNMKLVVSPCYHKMCEECVQIRFGKGPGRCPVPGCNQMLRRTDFMRQVFEDLVVEKEVMVRRKYARVFNKRQENFANLDDYNNYLEWTEEMIFNLVNDVDLPRTKAAIESYKNANAAIIARNSQLQVREDRVLHSVLAADRAARDTARKFYAEAREEEERKRREGKERLLEAMWRGEDVSADAMRIAGVDLGRAAIRLLPSAPPPPESAQRELEAAQRDLEELTGGGARAAPAGAADAGWADDPFDGVYEREDERAEGSPSLPAPGVAGEPGAGGRERYRDARVQRFGSMPLYSDRDARASRAGGYTAELWWGKCMSELYEGVFVGLLRQQ